MRRLLLILSVIMFLVIPCAAQEPSAIPARITLLKGDVQLRDEEAKEWLPAAINTPLYEGDRIWVPAGSRLEIQLQNGTFLRLNAGTAFDIIELSDDFQQFHLQYGHLYIHASSRVGDLQVNCPDATVKVAEKARLRIDVSDREGDEVAIFKGSAYVESDSGRARVRAGELFTVDDGESELAPLNPPDEWERWNAKRDRKQPTPQAARHLPEELMIYETELRSNGEWTPVAEYGYVWRPSISIGIEWAPYRSGRWVWRHGDYVWLPSESWGWLPHHYGRWVMLPAYGWCWVPPQRGDAYWAPGYVGWVATGATVAWVPLAPQEIYYGYGHYGRYSVNTRNVTTFNTPVIYRNVSYRNAVSMVNRNDFIAGRSNPRPAQGNPFLRERVWVPRQELKPGARQAYMPVVKEVPRSKLPPPALQQRPYAHLKERFPKVTVDPRPAPRQGNPPPAVAKQPQPTSPAKPQPTRERPPGMDRVPFPTQPKGEGEHRSVSPGQSVPPPQVSQEKSRSERGGPPPRARQGETPSPRPQTSQTAPRVISEQGGKPTPGVEQRQGAPSLPREGKGPRVWKVYPRNERTKLERSEGAKPERAEGTKPHRRDEAEPRQSQPEGQPGSEKRSR